MLAHGFAYQGEPSTHRGGKAARRAGRAISRPQRSSTSCRTTTRSAIARSATGWNGPPIPPRSKQRWRSRCIAPMPPMLFMGEEWGARTPFPFFCDFAGDLAEAIRRGRRKEFAEAYETFGDDVPDPLASVHVRSRKTRLGRARRRQAANGTVWSRRLLAVRTAEVTPRLAGASFGHAEFQQANVLTAQWRLGDGALLALVANLSDQTTTRGHAAFRGRAIWGGQPPERLPAWSVFWAVGDA